MQENYHLLTQAMVAQCRGIGGRGWRLVCRESHAEDCGGMESGLGSPGLLWCQVYSRASLLLRSGWCLGCRDSHRGPRVYTLPMGRASTRWWRLGRLFEHRYRLQNWRFRDLISGQYPSVWSWPGRCEDSREYRMGSWEFRPEQTRRDFPGVSDNYRK